jgi:hypothetical protein
MAKTFKEIRIYGEPSFPRQETSILGPLFTVTRYEGMDINGYMFYTMTQDKKSVYQTSGVHVRAVVDDSHVDDDDKKTDTYYGQTEEI